MKNARMNEFTQSDYKAYEGMHYFVRKEKNEHSMWWSGTVAHYYGIARFDMSLRTRFDKKEHRRLTIEFIHNGRVYRRSWNAWYGLKTITRLANQFIEEVTE